MTVTRKDIFDNNKMASLDIAHRAIHNTADNGPCFFYVDLKYRPFWRGAEYEVEVSLMSVEDCEWKYIGMGTTDYIGDALDLFNTLSESDIHTALEKFSV